MTSIIRSDDVCFSVCGGSRFSYQTKSKNELDKIIKSDSEDFGKSVLIEKQLNGSTNVTYSREGGFSIGEYILTLLPKNQSTNAIYAEQIKDRNGTIHKICVLIVDGKVVGDYSLDVDNGVSEFGIHLTTNSDVAFNIFCAVDNDLIRSESSDVEAKFFNLPDSQISTTVTCLPYLKNAQQADLEPFRFLSLSDVFKKSGRLKSTDGKSDDGKSQTFTLKNLFLLIVGIAGCAYIYNFYSGTEKEETVVDPYLEYKDAVASIYSPIIFLNEAIRLSYSAMSIKGWLATSWEIEGNIFKIKLKNTGGDISNLSGIKEDFGAISVTVDSESADSEILVTGVVQREHRNFPYVMYPINEIEYLLYTQAKVYSKGVLQHTGDVDKTVFIQKQFQLNLNDASINEIQEFAIFLKDRPIVLNKIIINPTLKGFNANISITIFGVNQ